MTIHSLSNPHHFVRDCETKGIYYEFMVEATACLGQRDVFRVLMSGRREQCLGGDASELAGDL